MQSDSTDFSKALQEQQDSIQLLKDMFSALDSSVQNLYTLIKDIHQKVQIDIIPPHVATSGSLDKIQEDLDKISTRLQSLETTLKSTKRSFG